MNFNPRSSENIKLLLLSSRHYSRLRVPQTNLLYIYISRDDSRKETGPENPTCILIKLYAIAAVTLAARQRIRTEMEYHVDRFYIYIYVQREDSQWKDQTGLETDAEETRGDKHRSRRRKEREGEGQRWREIKTERERGVETERKLLEVSGNWR